MAEQGTVRDAVVDAALVAGGTWVAHVLVTGALLLPRGGLGLASVLSLPLGALQQFWAVWLGYLLALGILVLSHRARTRTTRLWLSVPAAVVAWTAGTAVQALLVFADPRVFLLFGLPTLVQLTGASAAAVLVVSRARRPAAAAVGATGDAGVTTPETAVVERAARYSPVEIVGAAALAAAMLVAASFPMQWFSVYFRLWGPAPEATPEQGGGYLASLVVALALALASLGVAIRVRRRGMIAGSVVVLLLVAVLGFVCQVPSGTVWIDPSAPPEHEVDLQWQECAWDASKPGCGG